MKNTDPILNFRTLNEVESRVSEANRETRPALEEGHTTITKTREAADSSEHSETTL